MTAPYVPVNQPGQPQPQPQQPLQPMYPSAQPIYYAQNPGFAPAPAYGPPQVPQPQPQQFQQPTGADLNARLSGPGIPQELQGRTVAEGLRYYGVMREEFMRQRQMQQQQQPLQGQPQQGQPQGQPQQPPQPQYSAQPRVPQAPGGADPMRDYITQGLREVLPEMLAPVIQPMTEDRVKQTYLSVRQRFPDFQQYEGDVMQALQGAGPAQLTNPDVIEAAYFYAKGRAQSRGQQPAQPGYQPNWPSAGQQFQPQQPQPQAWNVPQPQFQQQPAFVEGPTPPAPQSFGPNGQQNDPRDEIFAKRYGMPLEVYRSWKTGQGQHDRLGVLRVPQAGIGPQQGNGQPMPQVPQQPQYPPQQFAPQPQYQQPYPGYFQPQLNGAGNGY